MADEYSDDNQYAPGQQDYSSETKTEGELIRIAMDQHIRANVNVWLPVIVTAVRNNSFVDVQIQILESFKVQGLVKLAPITNVPVEHPRGADWWAKLPIAVGDLGRITFCDRSLDNYLVKGGLVDPQDLRTHHISDALFIPGFYPSSNVLPGAASDMVFHNGSAEMYLQKAGTFKIINVATGQELFSNLVNLVTTLASASTVLGGPFVPAVVAQLTQIVNNLTGMKGK